MAIEMEELGRDLTECPACGLEIPEYNFTVHASYLGTHTHNCPDCGHEWNAKEEDKK